MCSLWCLFGFVELRDHLPPRKVAGKRNSPSPESAHRPPDRSNERLLLSQRRAGLEPTHAVGSPECRAEDAGCHCMSLSYSRFNAKSIEVVRCGIGGVGVGRCLFACDVMLLEAPSFSARDSSRASKGNNRPWHAGTAVTNKSGAGAPVSFEDHVVLFSSYSYSCSYTPCAALETIPVFNL